MTDRAEDLSRDFRGWVATASLAEIVVLLSGLEDELIERRSPAAVAVAQAAAMVRRQMERKG
jgi:hypothetical protein